MRYTVLIPARLASTRLPNKPLADLAGVPMVVRVAQRVHKGISQGTRVVVAGDDIRIVDACLAHNIEAIMTRNDHLCGSDRLAEACDILQLADEEIVVNVQGDEPLINTELVDAVAQLLDRTATYSVGTAAHPITDVADFINNNIVKVATDALGGALYFSRAPIPWWRDGFAHGIHTLPHPTPLRHIGIYSYRVAFLRTFPKLAPAPIEIIEGLEQLRVLWHSYRIAVHTTNHAPSPSVDTPEDLERVRQSFAQFATTCSPNQSQ